MALTNAEYEVERIISDSCQGGRRFFLVKWRGFSSHHDSWEPAENLNCPRLVREYFYAKGMRKPKSRGMSSTLLRSLNVSESRRSSILALTSPKSSPKSSLAPSPMSSRRSSVSSLVVKVAPKGFVEVPRSPVISEVPQGSAKDSKEPSVNEEAAKVSPQLFRRSLNLSASKVTPTAEAKIGDVTFCSPKTESSAQMVAASSPTIKLDNPKCESVDISTATTSEKHSSSSPEGVKLLASMGLTGIWPKIELARINHNQSLTDFERKAAELRRLGLVMVSPSPKKSADSSQEKVRRQRSRRRKPYSRPSTTSRSVPPRNTKRVGRRCLPVVDLTIDSSTEAGFSSSKLTSDSSWHNSTIADVKFSNKLQVRLFDQTPRPEVLTSVPFLENFESDSETMPEFMTEDSDKENSPKKRGRPYKRSRGRPNARKPVASDGKKRVTSPRTRKSKVLAADQISPKDLPKTDEAMVLLTEPNQGGGTNLVMFFPRLQIIKSIPEKMADKYYSQSVIDYYRRFMQPQPRKGRRSF